MTARKPRFRRRFLRHLRSVARFPLPPMWREIDVPVIDGYATLPDGRRVASTSKVVRVALLPDSA